MIPTQQYVNQKHQTSRTSEKCVNISIPSDSAFDNIAPGSSPADSSHSVQSMELPKVHEGSWIPTIKYAHTCRESESKLEKIE